MKKTIIAILLVLAVAGLAFGLTACGNKDELAIDSIQMEVVDGTVYRVGDVFDIATITITAILNDETEKTVSSSNAVIDYNKSDLKLDADGKFTAAGKFKLKMTYLRHTAEVELEILTD